MNVKMLLVLCLFLVPCNSANGEKTDALDGHLRLYFQDAVYTPVYFFENPETKVKVTLACVNHSGMGDYYPYIKQTLSTCDTVIYEDTPFSTVSFDESSLIGLREGLVTPSKWDLKMWLDMTQTNKQWLFSQYLSASYSAFIIGAYATGCELEADAFKEERNLSNWISGGMKKEEQPKYDTKDQRLKLKKLAGKINGLPGKKLAQQVWNIKMSGKTAERKYFRLETKMYTREYHSLIYNIYTGEESVSLYQEMYLHPVNEAMFIGIFDPLVEGSSDPTKLHIGLKYGVEHASQLTKLLMERGYVEKNPMWLASMSTKHIPVR